MIKRFNDYEQTQAYGSFEQLPKGGYIMKILEAKIENKGYGDYIMISGDVEGGEHHHYFAKNYKAQQAEDKKWRGNYLLNIPTDDGSEQDGWAKRRFKTFTEALEDSNPGYHFDWDEQKFKGKLIGGLFNAREYEKNDGTTAWATNWGGVCDIGKIKDGSFVLPKDRELKNKRPAASAPIQTDSNGFMSIPDGIDEEMPFK